MAVAASVLETIRTDTRRFALNSKMRGQRRHGRCKIILSAAITLNPIGDT